MALAREDFEALFDAFAGDVHRYVRRRVDGPDVDDVVAEVFLIAWRKRDEIPPGFEQPWLYRTAWNVVANLRRKHVDIPFEELPDTPGSDIADDVIDDVELRAAWATLSVKDREVLRLSAWEGLDGKELATVLGISVGGAGAALFRARERFARAMTSPGQTDQTQEKP